MQHDEAANAAAAQSASLSLGAHPHEKANAHGRFESVCLDKNGNERWRESVDNVVCTEGKNTAFNAFLNGSSYTVTGPYMGLISGVGYTGPQATDTAAQINGSNAWTEANTGSNTPTYTGNRKTCVWSSASAGAIALSAALSFAITGTGTVEGAFIIFGASASATPGNTSGNLWSAGAFSNSRTVYSGDTLNVSYSTSM